MNDLYIVVNGSSIFSGGKGNAFLDNKHKCKILLCVSLKKCSFAYHLCLLHLNIWVKDE